MREPIAPRDTRDPLDPLDPLEYRRLRAPRQHGGVLITPSLAEAGDSLRDNRDQLSTKIDPQLVAATRAEVLELALGHTSQYRDCRWAQQRSAQAETPWIVTGHQPQLYHPGVWIKNFALSVMAAGHQAIALNFLVDNDLCTESSLRIPVQRSTAPSGSQWLQETVLWDQTSNPTPFEDRFIHDAELFQTFAQRTEANAFALNDRPLIRELWPTAERMRREGRAVGECFAIARHTFEESVGLETLEAPLGRIFDLPTVRQWTAGILNSLPSLHSVYNSALDGFRRAHRIRSRSHPVPNLGVADDWLEAPFWVWSKQSPQRRPLWARATSHQVELSDGGQWQVCGDDFQTAMAIAAPTHRIRPRALMTTLFARTMLGDLFIHGIGGAKYDQLTDAIILNFLGVHPPKYLTITATIRLQDPPLDHWEREVLAQQRLLRDLKFNAQRHLSPTAETESLLARKAELLGQNHNLAVRHHDLKTVNDALQPWVQPLREQAQQRLEQARTEVRDARISGSREYSIAWHHAEELPRQLLDLCQKAQ